MTSPLAAAADAVTAAQHGRGGLPAPGLRLCPAALAGPCGTGPTRGRGIASESVTALAATAAGLRLSDANRGQRFGPLALRRRRWLAALAAVNPRPPSNRRVKLYSCTLVLNDGKSCNPNMSLRLDWGGGSGRRDGRGVFVKKFDPLGG